MTDLDALERLLAAGLLRRNALITDTPDFAGEWVAVPRSDFAAATTAVNALPDLIARVRELEAALRAVAAADDAAATAIFAARAAINGGIR